MKLRTMTRLALAGLLLAAMPARSATFTENFDDGVLDPSLSLVTTPGFSAAVADGALAVGKAAGTGNGDVKVETGFDVIGNFTASVAIRRTDLRGDAEMGLLVSYGPSGFANIYFVCSKTVNAMISSLGSSSKVDTEHMTAVFRATRSGNTLVLDYDTGSGFQTLHSASDTLLAGPVRIQLILLQRTGSTHVHVGTFDDFTITADQLGEPTPPPAGTGKCADGEDNDGDGLVDCADDGCAGDAACAPAEICGNCRDDDGNGLTDFEDPKCCGGAGPSGLNLSQGRIFQRAGASGLKLKGMLPSGTPVADLRSQDVFLQLRLENGDELLCARVPGAAFRVKGRRLKFVDKAHTVASAQGLEKLLLKLAAGGRVAVGAKSGRAPFAMPHPGSLRVTVGFQDVATVEGGTRCAGTIKPFKPAGRVLRFP
jgi:hypothetical protein